MPTPAVLYRISTAEIIKHADFPGDPTALLPGLDPDYQWFLVYQPFNQPDFDIRLFTLQRTESITNIAHPSYPLYSQYLVEFSTVKRPSADIAVQVDNAERAALTRVFPSQDQLKTIALGLGVLAKANAKLVLDPEEQQKLDDVIALSDKLWANSDNAAALKAAVLAGQQPDLDAGWVAPTP